MRLISELRRRNVLRMAALYVLSSWAVMQVAEVLIGLGNLPQWLGAATLAVLAIGFPIALLFSWFYEITPEGIALEKDVPDGDSITHVTGRRLDFMVIAVLIAVLVLFAYDKWGRSGPPEHSVAVLPFENLSADSSQDYLSDGLAEELLNRLAQIPELRVTSRTSAFSFKGQSVDLRTVADRLQVANILEGSVRLSTDNVRVSAQLIDAKSDSQKWSQTYDRRMTDVLDIQSDIAQSVAAQIAPMLSEASQKRVATSPTENVEAFDFYLRGREYLRRPAEIATLASAARLFNAAIELDPGFAQGHAGLCETHLENYIFSRNADYFEKARTACLRALTLQRNQWDVYLALGKLYRNSGQFSEAITQLDEAIALNPRAVDAYLVLADTYAAQNKHQQAEAMYRRAGEIESGYWGVHRAYGNFLYSLGRYPEAIERHRKVIQLAPDNGIGYDNLGNTYLAMGQFEQALETFDASPLPSRWTYGNRGLVHYFRGDYRSAADDQKRAIAIAGDAHDAWGNLADAYRFQPGEEPNARGAYERAIALAENEIDIDPNNWYSQGRVAMYYAYTGAHDKAREAIDRALSLTDDASAHYFAARVWLELGDDPAAAAAIKKVIDGGWPEILLLADPDVKTADLL
ncbi:MAG: tetratricopeptide repeat protein [Gammaproteobacteria bacterium]|nr:tetratricopeptide repeat protein [Gammaproteobacteria bacterium]NNF60675.1 tetratricopeptide repeat protein [Gammaproteobacteria bacterium]